MKGIKFVDQYTYRVSSGERNEFDIRINSTSIWKKLYLFIIKNSLWWLYKYMLLIL